MSGIYRDDRPALVVLGLMLGVIVLVAVLGLVSSYTGRQSIAQQNHADRNRDQEQANPTVLPSDFDFHWFGDSWAQWGMTALALAATGLSWRALILIRRTFEETKRTADAAIESNQTAREIGEAQTRAYLTCIGGEYRLNRTMCLVNFTLKNFGQSPATHGTLNARMIVPNMNSTGNDDQLIRSDERSFDVFFIPASGEDMGTVIFTLRFSSEIMMGLGSGSFLVSTECVLIWRDVFNRTQTINFFAVESDSRIESPVAGMPFRTGAMRISNSRPNQQPA